MRASAASWMSRQRQELPLRPFFFDLPTGRQDLLDRPAGNASHAGRDRVRPAVPRIVTSDPERRRLLRGSAGAWHEGIMAEVGRRTYEQGDEALLLKINRRTRSTLWSWPPSEATAEGKAGSRTCTWEPETRRTAARDARQDLQGPEPTRMLEWQTRKFQRWPGHGRAGPSTMVQRGGGGSLQRCPGESPLSWEAMALRFARVKRYREDKPASEADTVETVRRIFAGGRGEERGPR